MLNRTTRLWICSLILSLLGQLAWATSMPVLTDSVEATAHAHNAHEAASASASQTLDHCDSAQGKNDHGPATGHACCPLLGLEPVTALRVGMTPQPLYGPAAAREPHSEVVDAIFKPPKTSI